MQGFRELIQLHLAASAAAAAARRQAELRAVIEGMDARLAGVRDAVAAAEAELAEEQVKRRAVEGEIQLQEQARDRYRAQLMEAKTNEVYRTLLSEIETANRKISDMETTVLEHMEVGERIQARIDGLKGELADLSTANEAEAARLQDEIASLEQDRSRSAAAAASRESSVPAGILTRYQRIAEKREGRGMARAVDKACTECHVGIRPQVWVELVTKMELFQCPGCGRILFRDECLSDDTESAEPTATAS